MLLIGYVRGDKELYLILSANTTITVETGNRTTELLGLYVIEGVPRLQQSADLLLDGLLPYGVHTGNHYHYENGYSNDHQDDCNDPLVLLLPAYPIHIVH
jgi:hypothetical protein